MSIELAIAVPVATQLMFAAAVIVKLQANAHYNTQEIKSMEKQVFRELGEIKVKMDKHNGWVERIIQADQRSNTNAKRIEELCEQLIDRAHNSRRGDR